MTKEIPDLKFVGDDSYYLLGVPARDLSADEIEQRGWVVEDLIVSGLYEPVKKPAPAKQPAKGKE